MANEKKPVSFMEALTGVDPTTYDWKRTVDWTKVINGIVFAILIISVLLILVVGGVLHG